MNTTEATLAAVFLGALIGGGFSLLVAWTTAKAAAGRDEQRFRHEAEQATESRRQQRIERAYLSLLAVVNELQELMDTDRVDRTPPDYERASRQTSAVLAEMDAFGSPPVHESFNAFRGAWVLFPMAMHNARLKAGTGSVDDADLRHIHALQENARTAATRIRTQVAAELRGQSLRPS
jgi:hypothetical protein